MRIEMGLTTATPYQGIDTPPPSQPAPPASVEAEHRNEATPSTKFARVGGTHNLRIPQWFFRSRTASWLWLVVRVYLGYQWLNAGYQKIWGAERAFFWFGGGAGVKGFASAGIAGSAAGNGGASYGWWAAFLHNFVIPNASWIAKFIAVSEIVIGIALILGIFTGAAALAGLSLNVIYMFTGSAGVNPAFAVMSVLLILAWRNAGSIGLDRYILQGNWWRMHVTDHLQRSSRRGTAEASSLEGAC
jgi:thiosulfate dehydrogenase (quinone) large subunit